MDWQADQVIWLSKEEVGAAIAERSKRFQDMEDDAKSAEQKLRNTFKDVELVVACEQYAIKIGGQKFGESWTIAETWVNALEEVFEIFKEGQAAAEWVNGYFKINNEISYDESRK